MRDLLLLALVWGGAIAALRRPWIGMLLWTWLSLMVPHQAFAYAAATMPVAQIVAIGTLIGLLVTKERRNPMDRPAAWALLAFTIWITLTLPFSVYLGESLPLWERSVKIFLMIFVTIALIDSQRKLDLFIWVCTLSVAFYGVKGGLFTLLTGGGYRVVGPGGFIGGNNELALATIMVIPMLRYLHMQQRNRWIRLGLLAGMLLCLVSVLGSHSRGAFVAIPVMVFFLWAKSPNKLLGAVLLITVGLAVLSFMPDNWWARMNTIRDFEEDGSALGRLNAWTFCWNVASDRFMGGGFMIYSPELFAIYSPDPLRVHAAHSIYFQALGEHGFVGLFLFLLIGVLTWIDARRLIRAGTRNSQLSWAADLGRMVQVSMIGYAVGGAFLSLTYYDLPYNMMVMCVCAVFLTQRVVSLPVNEKFATARVVA